MDTDISIWGFSKIRGTFRGSHNKDRSILGSILGSLCLGKLPYILRMIWGYVGE